MTPRPKTLEEVDWEKATDAFVRSARNMTLAEIKERAEMGAARLDAQGHRNEAEVYRRVAAVLQKRLMN
jgi:hypothetical protein